MNLGFSSGIYGLFFSYLGLAALIIAHFVAWAIAIATIVLQVSLTTRSWSKRAQRICAIVYVVSSCAIILWPFLIDGIQYQPDALSLCLVEAAILIPALVIGRRIGIKLRRIRDKIAATSTPSEKQ